jgi:hypothetical protein
MYQGRMCGDGSGAGCLQGVGRLFVGRNGSVGGVLIGGRGRDIGSEGRTLSDASAGVTAVGASVLLDVERARTCGWIVRQHFGSEEIDRERSSSSSGGSCIPQRLHRTCVLLWRLPKDPVPLAARGC